MFLRRSRNLVGLDVGDSSIKVVELKELGALAVGISGSGPTVFALVNDFEVANRAAYWLDRNYKQNDSGFVHICRADLGGARCID